MLNACASIPWVVKLNSEGFSLPLGSLTLGSRSSSKKECAQASKGVRRAVGVYSSRREHRAMASGGVRGRNTWTTIRHKDGRQQWSREVYSWVFPDKRRHSTLQHTQTHTHIWTSSKLSTVYFMTPTVLWNIRKCNSLYVGVWFNEWLYLIAATVNSSGVWTQLQRATTAGRLRSQQEDLLLPVWLCYPMQELWVGLTCEGEKDRLSLHCVLSVLFSLRLQTCTEMRSQVDHVDIRLTGQSKVRTAWAAWTLQSVPHCAVVEIC